MAEDYKPVTAQDRVGDLGPLVTDLENVVRAQEEGVQHEAFVGYEEALDNYQSRSDVETLEQRLAREIGPSFDTAHFARQRGVLLGRDDKQLEAEDDPVAARKNVTARLKESKEFSQSQTAQTMDLTEDRNPSTKLEYPDDAVDYPGDDEE